MSGWYDVAQVCRNGHMITDRAQNSPVHKKNFCHKCGSGTLTQCSCGVNIQGHYHVYGFEFAGKKRPPAYCHACGKSFPWTAERVAAAIELLELAEDLNQEDREALTRSLPDLLSDGPRTQVASVRWQRFLAGGGRMIAENIRSVLVEIASEAAKKAIWGP